MQSDEIMQSKILIVDDESANVMLLEQMLEDEGYVNVVSTTDSRDVVGLHDTHGFDLILLDIRMPHMSGFDVLAALAESVKIDWVPVIVLTAQIDDLTRANALKAGARDFLNKPFRQWEIVLRIRNTLETRKLYKKQRTRAAELEELVLERTKQIQETKLMVIERLGCAGEFRDNDTGNHVHRMSKFCELLASAIGLSPKRAELIRFASPMHDVGKIGIPDNILLKPGSLDAEERDIMRRHAKMGAEIVGDHDDEVLSLARIMALYHHEKWDGSGYPYGLKGEAIPLEARIVAICDVFDALTSKRPYKDPWTIDDAMAFLHTHAGTHFDPGLVPVFHSILSEIVAIRNALPD